MWRGHNEEAKRGPPCGPRIMRNGQRWCRCSGVVAPPVCAHRVVPHRWVVRDGYNPSGSAVDAGLDAAHGCYGRRGRRMTVLCSFRRPSMCRPVPRQYMRNEWLDVTTLVPATACHQRNDVETYSRFMAIMIIPAVRQDQGKIRPGERAWVLLGKAVPSGERCVRGGLP